MPENASQPGRGGRPPGKKVNAAELKQRRQATGLPVLEFAPLVRLSAQHLWNIENGWKQPSAEALARIARELGCDPTELMSEQAA
jgi:transcriptional regulator with XRE-family HTH domain